MADERSSNFEQIAAITRSACSLELEPFLQAVIAAASEITGSEVAAILEFDEQDKSLRFLAVPPAHQDVRRQPIPIDECAAGPAIRSRRPHQLPNDRMPGDEFTGADARLASRIHSLLAVPLVLTGRVLGVLETINKDGSHYTEDDVTILETLASAAALAIDRRDLKNRMDASFAELVELDRLKSDFIAITSHELRTPLGVILGHATYLREILSPEFHEQADTIVKNASRLKEIVESVASMDNYRAGRSRVRQEAFPIGMVVREVADSFGEMAAERHITLRLSACAEDSLVEADHTKISIALGNLVKNALTFTEDGGHVEIQTQELQGHVKVSVIDDGIGIPRKDLPRVFDRFFQVERHLTRKHNGMGLGLSVAKVMIEMHGGRIWVESVEGQGSTFSFILPLRAVEQQPAMF